MSYQVLARKWRPRTFDELVGQEHVVRALVNGLDTGRLHHAFLFTGTRGVGKTTIARILAKCLNCETGVSSHPCGTCSTCLEVDEGRFVDLIEVDAASRTKVDDTRELLDNVQFAPTRGRYKVYLIDEVHMLSGHSFNALLKTLEEPPPHVKFLLATTDPQRLPVTVLSRCLQFNLKHLSAELIEAQLQKIIASENLDAEPGGVTLISRSAAGSMRDALSLLDQAIAYTAGKLDETGVREMLGTIDQGMIVSILQALVDNDAPGLISAVSDVAEHGMDFSSVLEELLIQLHRIAMAQVDKKLLDHLYVDEREQVERFSEQLGKEDVQLFYQIGIKGRQDLNMAPNPRIGLEMVLLRMHTFRLVEESDNEPGKSESSPSKPIRESKTTPVQSVAQVEEPSSAYAEQTHSPISSASNNWSEIVSRLKIGGLLQQLADNATMDQKSENRIELTLDQKYAQLHNRDRESELQTALQELFANTELKLEMKVGAPSQETPAAARKRLTDEKQLAAEEAIANDPNVKALQESFSAEINSGSIRPRN